MDLPRWLAWAGPPADADGGGAASGWRANLVAFRRLVFVHTIVRNFLLLPEAEVLSETFGLSTALRIAAIVAGACGLLAASGAWPARAVCLILLGEIYYALPDSTNHVAVELALMVLFTFLDERKRDKEGDEGRLLLCAVRWFVAVFFLYTGVQKLLYGYYFQGQFLAFVAATEERFAILFRWFIPDAEFERLLSYNEINRATGEPLLINRGTMPGKMRPVLGAGPYIVDSLLFKLLSNAVYLFEIVAGALLLVPRVRTLAALGAMAFVVLIEIGARELTFGLLMFNLLFVFLEGAWNKRLFWVLVGGYGALVLHDLMDWQNAFWYSPA